MPARRSGSAVVVLCLVQFVDVLGVMVMVTALPAMLAGLGAPASAAAPLVAGYPMFFGGLLMLGARLGDHHGHRQILLFGLVGFAAASLLAATAASVPVLVAARCAQGAASAASVPAALRLLATSTSDDDRRRRALAAWSATGAVAGVSGYLLGGLLTDLIGWRSVFWINLPLAAALVIAVRATVRRLPRDDGESLDVPGAVLLTGSVMGLVLGSSLLEQPDRCLLGLVVVAVGAALLVGFVAVERRAAHPLLPPAALRSPRLRLGVRASLLNTATTSSALTLAALHLQHERGLSPSAAALWLLPCSLGVVLGSALAAPLLRRRPPRTVVVLGLVMIAVGVTLLLALPIAEGLLPVAVTVAGLGIGLTSVAANTVGTDVPAALQGTASGALNTAAQLGTALGVAGLLLVAGLTRDTDLPLSGTPLAWAAAAALAGIAAASISYGSSPTTDLSNRDT